MPATSASHRPFFLSESDTLEQALLQHQAGDIAGARTLYEQILSVDGGLDPASGPRRAEAHYGLGCFAIETGAVDEAQDHFTAAVEANPAHAASHLNLGVIRLRLGDLVGAERDLLESLSVAPNEPMALYNLGVVRKCAGNVAGSLAALQAAVHADPENPGWWAAFAEAFQEVDFSTASDFPMVRSVLETLLAHDGIDHRSMASQVIRVLRSDPDLTQLIEAADARDPEALKSALCEGHGVDELNKPVVRLALERVILPDLSLEWLFTALRSLALDTTGAGRDQVPVELIVSLAQQCHLNGYVWSHDEQEVAGVEQMVESISNRPLGEDPLDRARIAVLGCYVALIEWDRAEEAVTLANETDDAALARLVLQQVMEPYQEHMLLEAIPTYGSIDDEVSNAVRDQYEEHPYPRWTSIRRHVPSSVGDVLHNLSGGVQFEGLDGFSNPQILIAGCGTGWHLAETSGRFRNASVTGVDLSLASLAYAVRKIDEAGIPNIRVLQADILALNDSDESFDIVESCGVLHHMADPVDGWRILADLVRPGGLMHIALYSELAREVVTEARSFIAESGFEATAEGIRASRAALVDRFRDQPRGPQTWRDFFSMEECRDLLFHVQEQCFTLPEIQGILDELGLEFLCFELPRQEIRNAFRQRFPEAGSEQSLTNWHAYEADHPKTFTAMYQFWVRKPA